MSLIKRVLLVSVCVAGCIAAALAAHTWLSEAPFALHRQSTRLRTTIAPRPSGSGWPAGRPPLPAAADAAPLGLSASGHAAEEGPAGGVSLPSEPESGDAGTAARPGAAPRSFTEPNHYLLVGVDRKGGRTSGGRADTIMVAVVDEDEDTPQVGIVSVPRDLYLEIPGHGHDRINVALPVARRAGHDETALLRDLVETTLQLPIHHTVTIDLATFERTVDILGGISVRVNCPIQDNFIDAASATGRTLLDVPAGDVEMTGKVAAMYARSRHGRSDTSRTRRQQAILLGIRERLTSLTGLVKLPALIDESERSVVTDLSRAELLGLARLAARLERSDLHGLVLGHRHLIPHRTEAGQSVVLPNYPAIDAALSELFDAPPPGTLPPHSRCQPVDAALR